MKDFDYIEIYGQNIVSVQSGATVGIEVLSRWNDSNITEAESLIAYLRHHNLLKAWDYEIIRRVINIIKDHKSNMKFYINLSDETLKDEESVNNIIGLIKSNNINNITLEISETIDSDIEAVIVNLKTLVDSGISIIFDDINDNKYAIETMQRVGVTRAKLTLLTLKDSHNEEDIEAIINRVKPYVDELVVEGIEYTSQLKLLQNHPENLMAQGYLFDKPKPLNHYKNI